MITILDVYSMEPSPDCLFLDAYSEHDFTEMNSVICGHHMNNDTMIYDLYVSRTSSSAWAVDLSDVGYEKWLFELIEKSCFTANVVPVQVDRVITLSTCSYEFNNARFVVHGILQEFS